MSQRVEALRELSLLALNEEKRWQILRAPTLIGALVDELGRPVRTSPPPPWPRFPSLQTSPGNGKVVHHSSTNKSRKLVALQGLSESPPLPLYLP